MKKKLLMICLVLGFAAFAPSMGTASASNFVTIIGPDVGPPHGKG
ncbi:hypothetical protein [Sporosarcina koreensis]|nr:hypothetical protein [Sporosarcina koreensis]